MRSLWMAAVALVASAVSIDLVVTSVSGAGLRTDPTIAVLDTPPIPAVPEGLSLITLNVLAPTGYEFLALSRTGIPSGLVLDITFSYDEEIGGPTPGATTGRIATSLVTAGLIDSSGGERVGVASFEADNARRTFGSDLEITSLNARARISLLNEVTTFKGLTITGNFDDPSRIGQIFPILSPLSFSAGGFSGTASVANLGGPMLSLVPAPVPLPASAVFLLSGFGALVAAGRRLKASRG